MHYVMVKKTPTQKGFNLLTTRWSREDALMARDAWQNIYPDWKLVVRESSHIYHNSPIYDDVKETANAPRES